MYICIYVCMYVLRTHTYICIHIHRVRHDKNILDGKCKLLRSWSSFQAGLETVGQRVGWRPVWICPYLAPCCYPHRLSTLFWRPGLIYKSIENIKTHQTNSNQYTLCITSSDIHKIYQTERISGSCNVLELERSRLGAQSRSRGAGAGQLGSFHAHPCSNASPA